MSDNYIRFNKPDLRIAGFYVLETSAPPSDPRIVRTPPLCGEQEPDK